MHAGYKARVPPMAFATMDAYSAAASELSALTVYPFSWMIVTILFLFVPFLPLIADCPPRCMQHHLTPQVRLIHRTLRSGHPTLGQFSSDFDYG